MDIGFMKLAEPVAWRVEPRVFVALAFDGTRLAPAWPLGAWENAEGRWQRAERPGKASQSHHKATTKPYTRHILGIDSGVQRHLKATPKPHPWAAQVLFCKFL
jgi:hypothetical protein